MTPTHFPWRGTLIAAGAASALVGAALVLGPVGSAAAEPAPHGPQPTVSLSGRHALPAAALAPQATVSLSGWQLTLPVDSSGCQCGDAKTVSPAAITSPWLTRNSSGSLGFWAPTKGATTPNSAHPRTELVSTSHWTGDSSTKHELKATLSIQDLPSGKDIIIGQIHGGGSSSSIPLLMLHYKSGDLVVYTRKTPSVSSSTTKTVLTGVPLNSSFSYTISESGKSMTVTADYDGKSGSATISLPSGFDGMELRFQAGDYQQTDANSSSTDGGRLTISSLSKD